MHLLDNNINIVVNDYKEELKKELVKFFKKKIAWRMFFFCPFTDFENKYDFKFTLSARWNQLHEEWVHSGDKRRGPDWRISLPWRKKTRGFPAFTCYLKNSIEMKIGLGLTNLIIDVLDGLMYDMKETAYHVTMVNGEPAVSIRVVENVRKIRCA